LDSGLPLGRDPQGRLREIDALIREAGNGGEVIARGLGGHLHRITGTTNTDEHGHARTFKDEGGVRVLPSSKVLVCPCQSLFVRVCPQALVSRHHIFPPHPFPFSFPWSTMALNAERPARRFGIRGPAHRLFWIRKGRAPRKGAVARRT